MNIVLYNINGKYFNFEGNYFGAFIQSSDGLFNELKPKVKTQYNWPEQNGVQISSRAPKYESREITLKGWIEGSDWMDMRSKFDSLFGEFRRPGKQRLEITPFGEKTLVYEVITIEEIKFEKKFRRGEMIGTFSVTLLETNPIKKVVSTLGYGFYFYFNTENTYEINLGPGVHPANQGDVYEERTMFVTGNSDVDIEMPLKRIVSGYPTENLIRNSNFIKRDGMQGENGALSFEEYLENPDLGFNIHTDYNGLIVYYSSADHVPDFFQMPVPLKPSTYYTLSFWYRALDGIGSFATYVYPAVGEDQDDNYNPIDINNDYEWHFVTQTFKTLDYLEGSKYFLMRAVTGNFEFKQPKLEIGTKATEWNPSPLDFGYVTIAGDIDYMNRVEDFGFNGLIEWERL